MKEASIRCQQQNQDLKINIKICVLTWISGSKGSRSSILSLLNAHWRVQARWRALLESERLVQNATGDLEIAKFEDTPPTGAFNLKKKIRLRKLAVRQRSTLPRGWDTPRTPVIELTDCERRNLRIPLVKHPGKTRKSQRDHAPEDRRRKKYAQYTLFFLLT